MTSSDLLLEQKLLRLFRQFQKSQRVRHGRTALRHRLCNLRLGKVASLHHTPIAVSLLYGIEIGALNVLDKCQLKRLIVISFFDANGNRGKSHHLACLPTALPSNDLVLLGTHGANENRLQQAVFLDGSGQLFEFFALEVRTRLIRIRRDGIDRHFVRTALRHALDGHAILVIDNRFLRGFFNELLDLPSHRPILPCSALRLFLLNKNPLGNDIRRCGLFVRSSQQRIQPSSKAAPVRFSHAAPLPLPNSYRIGLLFLQDRTG